MSTHRTLLLGSLILALGCSPSVAAETTAQAMPEYMDMLNHAISVETVQGKDQVPALARYFADKLEAAGFAKSDIETIPVGNTEALVVRYRGNGKGKPFIVHGHGVPTYGVSLAFAKPGDVHAHGYNERILASELPASLDFWHELLPALAK